MCEKEIFGKISNCKKIGAQKQSILLHSTLWKIANVENINNFETISLFLSNIQKRLRIYMGFKINGKYQISKHMEKYQTTKIQISNIWKYIKTTITIKFFKEIKIVLQEIFKNHLK